MKPKVGHKGGTQPPLNPVPSIPYTFRRDGRYYVRKRIPSDLIRLKCYGDAKEVKRSLETADPSTARRLALTQALQIDEEFSAKRRECQQAGIETCVKKSAERRLVDLTQAERTDFVVRFFITQEKQAKIRTSTDEEARAAVLKIVGEDLQMLEVDSPDPARFSVKSLETRLLKEGISIEDADDQTLRDINEKLHRALTERAWRTVRALTGHPHESRDPFFKDYHADTPFPVAAPASKTVGDLCKEYLEHKRSRIEGGHIAKSSLPKFKMHCLILQDFLGASKLLTSISTDDASRLVEFLPNIPQNAAKRYPKFSLVTAAERESGLKLPRLLHPSTVEDYHAALAALLSHAIELKWMSDNPLRGKLVREKLPRTVSKDRDVLTTDEMNKVFSSDDYLRQRLDSKGPGQARFWVPLICLLQGTRSNEVAGMLVTDVESVDGIAFLNLRETTEHRLKNQNSVRRVPLHQQLMDIGFLEFVEERRKHAPDGQLFTGLIRNRNGSMSDAVGKWWQRLMRELCGEPSPDAVTGARGLHSLRHSWVTAARAAGVDESIRKRLGGWAQGNAAGDYGWAGALPMLKTAIDKIEFSGVRFPPRLRRITRN
ncbi:MAG: site-specific integrase [Luteolibacter sp.]